jgi:hypothetical protein
LGFGVGVWVFDTFDHICEHMYCMYIDEVY